MNLEAKRSAERYLNSKGVRSWADVQRLDRDQRYRWSHLNTIISGLFSDFAAIGPYDFAAIGPYGSEEMEALYQHLFHLRDKHDAEQDHRRRARDTR